MTLQRETLSFLHSKAHFGEHARQTAAMFLLGKLDLDAALNGTRQERKRMAGRLRRLMERERLRGGNRHWSYDLNRHIALKQVHDRLLETDPKNR